MRWRIIPRKQVKMKILQYLGLIMFFCAEFPVSFLIRSCCTEIIGNGASRFCYCKVHVPSDQSGGVGFGLDQPDVPQFLLSVGLKPNLPCHQAHKPGHWLCGKLRFTPPLRAVPRPSPIGVVRSRALSQTSIIHIVATPVAQSLLWVCQFRANRISI